jgi:integrase
MSELRAIHLFAATDPIFPATRLGVDPATGLFAPLGLSRDRWSSARPVRAVFRRTFEWVGLPYVNPHAFRDMVTLHGQAVCESVEEFKARSQNLGHDQVMTTLTSYGTLPAPRQGELMKGMAKGGSVASSKKKGGPEPAPYLVGWSPC